VQRHRARRALAHLVLLLADDQPASASLDDEAADAGAPRSVGAREHQVEAGVRAARDPHLGTVEDPAVVVAPRAGRERGGVRSAPWLAEGEARGTQLAGGVRPEPARLLRRGRVIGEDLRREVARGEDDRARRAALGDGFHGERVADVVGPCAAVLQRYLHGEEPELRELADLFQRKASGAIALGRTRCEAPCGEVARGGGHQALLVGEWKHETVSTRGGGVHTEWMTEAAAAGKSVGEEIRQVTCHPGDCPRAQPVSSQAPQAPRAGRSARRGR
jgi:hypothetical protein